MIKLCLEFKVYGFQIIALEDIVLVIFFAKLQVSLFIFFLFPGFLSISLLLFYHFLNKVLFLKDNYFYL